MRGRILLLFAVGIVAWAQQSVAVAPEKYTYFIESDGAGNPVYVCRAISNQPTTQFSVQFGNLVNINVTGTSGVITFTAAHGFQPGYKVVISGSATTALNGIYRVVTSDPASTNLSITTAGVAPGIYTDPTVSTDTALLTKPIWAIGFYQWVNGNNVSNSWTNGSRDSYNQICANRAVVNGAAVVTFK